MRRYINYLNMQPKKSNKPKKNIRPADNNWF